MSAVFERKVRVPYDAIDIESSGEFYEWLALEASLHDGDVRVDFGGVRLITAAGVGQLCRVQRDLGTQSRRLVCTNASGLAGRVLALCGFEVQGRPPGAELP